MYDEENMKLYLPGGWLIQLGFFINSKMYEYYLKCDEIEQAKVQSGELKNLNIEKKNANALKLYV